LKDIEMQVPEADPVSVARMKYEAENRVKSSMIHNTLGVFSKSPDVLAAAKSGSPAMAQMKPSIPASVPMPLGAASGVNDVGGQVLTGASDLDKKDDARLSAQTPGGTGSATSAPAAAPATPAAPDAAAAPAATPLPTNRQGVPVNAKKLKKEKKIKVKN